MNVTLILKSSKKKEKINKGGNFSESCLNLPNGDWRCKHLTAESGECNINCPEGKNCLKIIINNNNSYHEI